MSKEVVAKKSALQAHSSGTIVYHPKPKEEVDDKPEKRLDVLRYVMSPTDEQLKQFAILPKSQIVHMALTFTRSPSIVYDPERIPGTLPVIFNLNVLALTRSIGGAMIQTGRALAEIEMAGQLPDDEDNFGRPQ